MLQLSVDASYALVELCISVAAYLRTLRILHMESMLDWFLFTSTPVLHAHEHTTHTSPQSRPFRGLLQLRQDPVQALNPFVQPSRSCPDSPCTL